MILNLTVNSHVWGEIFYLNHEFIVEVLQVAVFNKYGNMVETLKI